MHKCNGGPIRSDLNWIIDKSNLRTVMKFLNTSNSNSKRLFVPINEFEFNGFVVRVRRVGSGKLRVGCESPQRGSRLCTLGLIAPSFAES